MVCTQACYDVGRVKLLDLNHTQLYTLQSFFTAQKAHREEVERQLSRFHYATVDTVKEACGEAVAALEEALFGNKSDELGMGDSMRRSGRVDDRCALSPYSSRNDASFVMLLALA